jgi:Fur family zinc uptake transcriptional regulator
MIAAPYRPAWKAPSVSRCEPDLRRRIPFRCHQGNPAHEILDLLRPKDPSATPAGVYRSLDFLTELGLVHRIESAKSFIACAMPDHVHPSQMLVCRRCGTVVETEDSRVAKATESLGRRLGFALDRDTMELVGLCSSCQG